MRLALSMKQLQADPLLETLDTLMPVEAQVYYPVNYFTSPCTEGRIYCGMHCYLISSSCAFDLIKSSLWVTILRCILSENTVLVMSVNMEFVQAEY
jgi:hypothetical protein